MCNRLYKYLSENEISCKILLGFPAGHSTEYAILKLIAQRSDSFNLLALCSISIHPENVKTPLVSDVSRRYRNGT